MPAIASSHTLALSFVEILTAIFAALYLIYRASVDTLELLSWVCIWANCSLHLLILIT